jgi:uncharacterized membrane protein
MHSTWTRIRWAVIFLCLIVSAISAFPTTGYLGDIMPIASAACFFVAACLHGLERYGAVNTLIFFLITWTVSHAFEVLSINTGFPFGYYYYKSLIGPRLFDVPLVIMFAYFGMGYFSWILSTVLVGPFGTKLEGLNIFYVPLIATFIMVMWDLVMDPVASTIDSLWVWWDGGRYFGVPAQNYFGWFFVVYIIMQLFALFISRFDWKAVKSKELISKEFWMEAAILYGSQGLVQIAYPFLQRGRLDIYQPMAIVTVFTMMFVTILSFILIDQLKTNSRYTNK